MKTLHLEYSLKCILFLGYVLLCNNTLAQTYQLEVRNEPFVFLEDPQIALQGPWDQPEFQVPLGFDFEFFDITSDRLFSAENSFGGYTSLNQDEEHLYMLIHFYALLVDRGTQQDSALSPIYFKTEGVSGQRVFTLEYKNAGLFHGLEDENAIFLDYINLQTRVFEASGDIEFHIGPYSILEDPEIVFDGFPGPVIGLMADVHNVVGGEIGEVILLSGDPLVPTVTDNPMSFITWPVPENTVYRFSKVGSPVHENQSVVGQPLFFPNPTSDVVYFNEKIARDVKYPIDIFDTLGNLVDQWCGESEFSVSNLTGGVYYLVTSIKDNVVSERILVLPK